MTAINLNEVESMAYSGRKESYLDKLMLKNLPKIFFSKDLEKLMESKGLETKHVRTVRGKDLAFVTVADEETLKRALIELDGLEWEGTTLSASRKVDHRVKEVAPKIGKIFKTDSEETDQLPIAERVVRAVTPFAHLSYEEQLEKKQHNALHAMRTLGNGIAKNNMNLMKFVEYQKLRRVGSVCELDYIISSPVIDGYRNTCDFSVGINAETNELAIGFRVASYRNENDSVAPVKNLPNVNDTMKALCVDLEKILKASKHECYDPITHEGVWSHLMMRTSVDGQCMVMVSLHPQKLEESELKVEKDSLINWCKSLQGGEHTISSLYVSMFDEKENRDDFEHLWGSPYLTETMLDKVFRISSPRAFFQRNTPAAEKFHEALLDAAGLDDETVVLDMYCGIGTIGLLLAEHCSHVYGLEIWENRVADAQHNAATQGACNTTWMAGDCRDTLPLVLKGLKDKKITVVLDPSNRGIATGVMSNLRATPEVQKIVYVGYDLTKMCRANLLTLTRYDEEEYGVPFVPMKAVPVDNSPHTDGFYIVLVMERYNPERWDNIMKGTPLPDDEEYAKTIPKQKPTRKQLTTNHKTKKRRNKRKRAEQRKRDECLNYNYNPMDDEIMAEYEELTTVEGEEPPPPKEEDPTNDVNVTDLSLTQQEEVPQPPKKKRAQRPPREHRPPREQRPPREPKAPREDPKFPAPVSAEASVLQNMMRKDLQSMYRLPSETDHRKKVFVGNLNFTTTEATLTSHFQQYGEIQEIILIKDKRTKRPKGFGYIVFTDAAMVDAALKKTDLMIDGREITVKTAHQKLKKYDDERPPKDGSYGSDASYQGNPITSTANHSHHGSRDNLSTPGGYGGITQVKYNNASEGHGAAATSGYDYTAEQWASYNQQYYGQQLGQAAYYQQNSDGNNTWSHSNHGSVDNLSTGYSTQASAAPPSNGSSNIPLTGYGRRDDTTGYGAPTTPQPNGAPTGYGANTAPTTGYGAQPNGAQSTGYGTHANIAPSTGYGTNAPQSTGYGANTPQSTGYGTNTAPPSTGYGTNTAQTTGYGASIPQSTGYGASPAPSTGYGANTAPATGYGSSYGTEGSVQATAANSGYDYTAQQWANYNQQYYGQQLGQQAYYQQAQDDSKKRKMDSDQMSNKK